MRIVLVSGRYTHAGRYRKWSGVFPSARYAELAAAFADRGHSPVLVADADVHVPVDIAHLVWRHDPDAVVVCGDSVPTAVVDVLRTSPVTTVVTTAGIPPMAGAIHQTDLMGVLAAAGAPSSPNPSPPEGSEKGTRSGVVPPSLRAEVGVELARLDADGTVRPNDPAVIVRALSGARPVSSDSVELVRLGGMEDLPEAEAAALLATMADQLDAPVQGASLRVRAGEASAAIAGAAAHVVGSVGLVVMDQADVAALRVAIGTFEHTGLDVSISAHFGDDLEIVEDVADIALSTGVALSYVWNQATSPATVDDGERILAATGSPTLAEQAVIGPVGPLAALLSGRFDSGAGSGAIDALLVTSDSAVSGIEAAGLRTEVFCTSAPADSHGRPWLLEGGSSSEVPMAGDGEVRLDGLSFEAIGYRQGRHATPFESLVLRFGDLGDIEAFLADADIARRDGRFPAALLSGFTLLADACAWGPAGDCHCGQLRRAACTDGSHIRTAPHGPVVGHRGQTWSELARSARQQVAAAKARRGCQDCPIAALCSKDLCLSDLITDEQYCRHRQARPWLVGYLDAIDAIRKVRRDPAQPVPRVGGFGGPIHEELAGGWWPDRPDVVVMVWQGGYYGYVPAGDQAFRLTPDTAFIVEALMVAHAPGAAAAAIEARFGLSVDQTAVAVGRVERLLDQRGAPISAAKVVGPTGARP